MIFGSFNVRSRLEKMCYRNILLPILLLYVINLNSVNSDKDSPRIIIVGTGAAGIAAASKLFQNGFKNITILEAKSRIGGRIHTTQFESYLVDLGGQYVHGEIGNIAFELASPLGLLDKGDSHGIGFAIYDSSGVPIDDNVMNVYLEIYNKSTEYAEKHNGPIGKYFKNELNKYIESKSNLMQRSKGLLHMFDMYLMVDDGGDSWCQVSTTMYTEFIKRYQNPEEELPIIQNTVLNAEVSLIYNDERNGKAVVTTNTGETYVADHVIVTTSLGVLKEQYKTLFKPPLSKERVETVKGLGFGSEVKIFLSFDKPWWKHRDTGGVLFLWRNEDILQLENDPEKSWLLGLSLMLFDKYRPQLLCIWVSGKYARDVDRLPDQKVSHHLIEVLKIFYGKSANVTMPTGMKRMKWNVNKHFKGTYSFRSVKSDTDDVWHETLAKPIGKEKPVILFAGEATHPHFFSTVHGAIETGFREAERLTKLYPNLSLV